MSASSISPHIAQLLKIPAVRYAIIVAVVLIWIGVIVVQLDLRHQRKTVYSGAGAPFIPTDSTKLQAVFGRGGLLDTAKVFERCRTNRASIHLIDLGSGGGSVVRAATRIAKFGRASGFEINPFLVTWSRLLSIGRSNERFHREDMWLANLSDADVVVVYQLPHSMERMAKKLIAELRPSALVISNRFEIPGLGQAEIVQNVNVGRLSTDESSAVYVYRMDAQAGAVSPKKRR